MEATDGAGVSASRGRKQKEARKRRKNRGKEEEKFTPGEEEGKGVTCPSRGLSLIGKIPFLIPEVFHDFKFFYTKIFNHKIIYTPLIKYLQYKLFTKYFTQN